jgi:hypothetical protein
MSRIHASVPPVGRKSIERPRRAATVFRGTAASVPGAPGTPVTVTFTAADNIARRVDGMEPGRRPDSGDRQSSAALSPGAATSFRCDLPTARLARKTSQLIGRRGVSVHTKVPAGCRPIARRHAASCPAWNAV